MAGKLSSKEAPGLTATPLLSANRIRGDSMIEDLTPLVANLGFPIVVSLYLLVRVEKKLEELSGCIKEANKNISKLL